MLTISHIDDFLMRVGIQDMQYSVSYKDSFGDIISVFDPDFKYSTLDNAINQSRPVRNKVVNSGVNFTELHDDIYIDGNKVRVAILCEVGDRGFGTSIKIMVKNITVFIDGDQKIFLGFESMRNYINKVSKEDT